MAVLDEFRDILQENVPLAPFTSFGVGGPAEWLATPRTKDELSKLVRRCKEAEIFYRILGGGTNVLVPDEGVSGVVIRLTGPELTRVDLKGTRVKAGAGALLGDVIAQSAKSSASGLEILVGIPGTVGGAIRQNAGGRGGDIGQHVYSVDVMDEDGEIETKMRADIRFGYRQSNLDDVIILDTAFELVEENPEDIVRRIKKIWITKKANQPFGFQASGYVFRNPRGLSAVELMQRAELTSTRVGGAEISDRDPRFVIAHPGATARDILRLIDMVRSRVEEKTKVVIELQVDIW